MINYKNENLNNTSEKIFKSFLKNKTRKENNKKFYIYMNLDFKNQRFYEPI